MGGRRIVYPEEGQPLRQGASAPPLVSVTMGTPPGPIPLPVVASVMDHFPPIHSRDPGRSPRPSPGPRPPHWKGGMQERRRGTRPPPPIRSSGFRSLSGLPRPRRSRFFFAAGRRRQTFRSARALLRSRPVPLSAWPCGSVLGPVPHVGEVGEAGEQAGGSGPETAPASRPGSVPVGPALVRGLRRSRPFLAAATPWVLPSLRIALCPAFISRLGAGGLGVLSTGGSHLGEEDSGRIQGG
ncbi:hypothetical protein NDU88_003585 [Pleurodeles waltl]|uniref:Uncharacterized protein n=1 Tax=Pleurodeles waltl TaxID=8319 RepID=A0AAV7LM16_PLEWA|nr:hypothetical protein NDU88_003585 [Pleurodeles waltl]